MSESKVLVSFGGRGRKSILPSDVHSKVGDHDFDVASLTPSVTLVVDFDGRNNLDEEVQLASFYRGRAHVCLKDSIFQSSNVEKHAVELPSLSIRIMKGALFLARFCL